MASHHGGNPAKSRRLKDTLRILKDYGRSGVSTATIQRNTSSMAVASDVADLRKNGHLVDCRCDMVCDDGTRIYRYTYRGKS